MVGKERFLYIVLRGNDVSQDSYSCLAVTYLIEGTALLLSWIILLKFDLSRPIIHPSQFE